MSSHLPQAERGGQATEAQRPRILLVSRSPRRRTLLNAHGLAHEAIQPGFEDSELVPGRVDAAQWVASLAFLKAWAGAEAPEAREQGGRLVIGADTACLQDGRLIGTPRDEAEARSMLRGFSNAEHEVLTGVAVLDLREFEGPAHALPESRQHLLVDRARVRMAELTEGQIGEYIASGGWRGKAGAYNLAERLDAGWPIHFEGDESTIMGLPMRALMSRLSTIAPDLIGGAAA